MKCRLPGRFDNWHLSIDNESCDKTNPARKGGTIPLTNNSVKLVKWSVYYHRKGKWRRKRFDTDFGAALKFYDGAKSTTHPPTQGVTLHSDNVAFAPPNHITHATKIKWEIVRKRVKVKGVQKIKRFKRKIEVEYNKMKDYNHEGIWWCPYCIKLRRFKEVSTDRGVEMCCPVCWASQYVVREYNPFAMNLEYREEKKRGR